MAKERYRSVTSGEFELFKKYVLKWIDFFGLKDAEIDIVSGSINDDGDCAACVEACSDNRYFVITLEEEPIDRGEERTDEYLDYCAAHEVLEVLMYPLRNKAVDAGAQYEAIDEDIHRIIRTIENTCLKPIIEGGRKCSGSGGCSCKK